MVKICVKVSVVFMILELFLLLTVEAAENCGTVIGVLDLVCRDKGNKFGFCCKLFNELPVCCFRDIIITTPTPTSPTPTSPSATFLNPVFYAGPLVAGLVIIFVGLICYKWKGRKRRSNVTVVTVRT